MGYTKVIQSGDITEIYTYSKPYVHTRKTNRGRRKSTRTKDTRIYVRSSQSIKRARESFFRLIVSNLSSEEIPAFVTATHFQAHSIDIGYLHLRHFYTLLKRKYGAIRAISVPEWQPDSGFLHFHLLIWGLPEIQKQTNFERDRRILQRLWHRGYIDVRPANDRSPAIAGYMAKYMSKAMQDSRLIGKKAYSATRNVLRSVCLKTEASLVVAALDLGLDPNVDNWVLQKQSSFATMFLGRATYKRLEIPRI